MQFPLLKPQNDWVPVPSSGLPLGVPVPPPGYYYSTFPQLSSFFLQNTPNISL